MSAPALTSIEAAAPVRPRSWARRAAWGGLGLLAGFALLGPLVLPDPSAQELSRFLESPSWTEPLGRDEFGRSVISRVAHATRLSLALAVLCVATALILGTTTGILAAWRGGWLDGVLRSISEIFVALPALLIVLLFAAMADGSLWTLYIGLALAQWVEYFRVVRARASLVLASPAVEAAGLLKVGTVHVVARHLLPDLRPLLTTLASLGMVTAILAMATLGFVKVGLQPPRAELGLMVTESFPYYDVAPWMAIAPVAVLFGLTICLLGVRRSEATR